MRQHRGADALSEDPRREEHRYDAEAQVEVLADDSARLSVQPDRERQMAQIVGHKRDMGGFERDTEPAAPIAMPTVAFAIAGASFTPSPIMATLASAEAFV